MIVILGGGLAGLSAAYHLDGFPVVVLEAEKRPGGMCRTREMKGFSFDYAGHLLHLRDPRAMALVDDLIPGTLATVTRKAFIQSMGALLPFPFQANLHGLPAEVVAECLCGFVRALGVEVPEDPEISFEEWSLAVFGEGISRRFMFPYNEKLYRRKPANMTADWVSWAVPRPDLDEVVRGALGIENIGMGYNPTFKYPRTAGIELLPRALARRIDTLRCNSPVRRVDLDTRRVVLTDGETIDYEQLVVTCPLPAFLSMAKGGSEHWQAMGERLDWSAVSCVNLGVDRPGVGGGAHWIYFPDGQAPFYRVGFPTNFSGGVAPPGTSSMYVEFGLRRDEFLDPDRIEAIVIEGLCREGILTGEENVLVCDPLRLDPGYVIFDRARREVMSRAVPALQAVNVHLIGRYGAWSYSYMERALLDGLELPGKLGM